MTETNNKILIEIDPDIADLVPNFLGKRGNDIKAIHGAIQMDNFEEIFMIAHKMKGSSGLYGFAGLSDIARSIETEAKNQNGTAILSHLKQAEDYLARIKIVNL